MDSRLALEGFAGILVVAGPVLFIVFCMTFREDPRDHPIYRRPEKKPRLMSNEIPGPDSLIGEKSLNRKLSLKPDVLGFRGRPSA